MLVRKLLRLGKLGWELLAFVITSSFIHHYKAKGKLVVAKAKMTIIPLKIVLNIEHITRNQRICHCLKF